MKKRFMIIPIAAVIVILAVAVFYTFRGKGDDGALVLSGTVEVTEVHVGFKIPGRMTDLLTDEGRKVAKGERLALLDNRELAAIVGRERAVLEEASSRLKELQAGSRPQEIEQAKANLAAQEAELVKARKDRERAEILYGNGAISAAQYDGLVTAYDNRRAQMRYAVERLGLVKEGPRKEDIEAGRARVSQARAALAASEERLKDTVIYAPLPGVVLKKHAEPGETIAQGAPVVTIGDLERPWVKVYVKEAKLGLVKLGQKATITTDTYRDRSYEGTVTSISSEAEFTPKNVQTQEERVKLVFAVKVSVKNDKDELKPGMPADVRIEIR